MKGGHLDHAHCMYGVSSVARCVHVCVCVELCSWDRTGASRVFVWRVVVFSHGRACACPACVCVHMCVHMEWCSHDRMNRFLRA